MTAKKLDWTMNICDRCEHSEMFKYGLHCWHPDISNNFTKSKLIPKGESVWTTPIPDWCPLEDSE